MGSIWCVRFDDVMFVRIEIESFAQQILKCNTSFEIWKDWTGPETIYAVHIHQNRNLFRVAYSPKKLHALQKELIVSVRNRMQNKTQMRETLLFLILNPTTSNKCNGETVQYCVLVESRLQVQCWEWERTGERLPVKKSTAKRHPNRREETKERGNYK